MRFWLPALVAVAVLPVGAHHPFTPYGAGVGRGGLEVPLTVRVHLP
jgi:hypothetical protein